MLDLADIEILRLVLDFGVLVLIWLVQLVIYPGLTFYSSHDLKRWHPRYTQSVTIIVLPLMLGQLVLSLYIFWYSASVLTTLHLALVCVAWALTFLQAVPLHRNLEHADTPLLLAEQLVNANWLRTIVWTCVFLSSVVATFI